MKILNLAFNLINPKISIVVYADKLLEISEILLAKTTDQNIMTKLNKAMADTNTAINGLISLKSTDTNARTQLAAYKKQLTEIRQMINQVRSQIKIASPIPTAAQ